MPSLTLRRASYYTVVFVAAVAVHQGFVASLFGSGVSDLLRRNSEAYAMMLIIPAYWDMFAAAADPDGRGSTAVIGRRWWGQAVWFVSLVLAAIALQSSLLADVGVDLRQAIVTLGEAFIAGIVVCLYLGWSRSLLPGVRHEVTGAPVVSSRARLAYYAAVVVLAIVVQQSWFASLAGDRLVDWLQVNIEAYAAMMLVPAYYDVVAASDRRWVRPVWYTFLVATPVLVQGGFLDSIVAESFLTWMGRTTEAFIATFAISAYVDVWRGRSGRGHARSTEAEVTDRSGEEPR